MSYSLKAADKTVLSGMTRIAGAQTVLALTALSDPSLTLDLKVHAVRRRIKKLRALIRLIRPVFPAYKQENAALREAGRRLSEARDAAVMTETFERLAVLYANYLSADIIGPVRERLCENRRAISDAGIGIALLETETDLKAFAARLVDWKIRCEEVEAFEEGLAASYKRAAKTLRHAKETGDSEDLHEWRKWTKYHWLQLRLIKRIWPEGLDPRNAELDLLTDELGEHHDLSVLCTLLREQEDVTHEIEAFLKGPAAARLTALEEIAFSRGQDLFAEDPALFARRCAAFWDVWRKEGSLLFAARS